ncbi:MAG: hypothetical protein H0T79_21980 [Deltaproteobacteria bacterium]|nr:hypothetical protein [Deltaproteobacteria bacterium]
MAIGALIPLVVDRAPRSAAVVVERYAIPLVVPAITTTEPPLHVTPPRRIGCTLPVSQIGLVANKYLDAHTPTGLTGVAASATGCTIAVWGAREVYVSRDDGASMARLAAPSPPSGADAWAQPSGADAWAQPSVEVAVSAAEVVYVLRSGRLELERRDGTLLARAIPHPSFEHIHASDRWIVLRSADQLAASEDEGITWHLQPVPAAMTAAAIRVGDDGALHLAAVPGKAAPVTYYLGNVRGGGWRAVWTSPPHRPYVDPSNPSRGDSYHSSIDAFAFGTDGQLHAERYDAYGIQVFAVAASGTSTISEKLGTPGVLRGVTIVGPAWGLTARDAHGAVLTIVEGRGPVRTFEQLDHVMTAAWTSGGQGRWLVGGVVP